MYQILVTLRNKVNNSKTHLKNDFSTITQRQQSFYQRMINDLNSLKQNYNIGLTEPEQKKKIKEGMQRNLDVLVEHQQLVKEQIQEYFMTLTN